MHIRQYIKYGDRIYPSPQGIRLTIIQFANLMQVLEAINKDVQDFRARRIGEFKYNIGDGVYVTAGGAFDVIHIRYYFQNDGMEHPLPSKSGIGLRFTEWEQLASLVDDVKKWIEMARS